LHEPWTTFAFNPCDIAAFATDAPGAAHLSSTDAYNCALCGRHKATLCSAILSTYFLMKAIVSRFAAMFEMGRLAAYPGIAAARVIEPRRGVQSAGNALIDRDPTYPKKVSSSRS